MQVCEGVCVGVRRGVFVSTLPVFTVPGTVKVSNWSPNTTRLSSLKNLLFSRRPEEGYTIGIHVFVRIIIPYMVQYPSIQEHDKNTSVMRGIGLGTAVADQSHVACVVGL